jgi:hypothetical protein
MNLVDKVDALLSERGIKAGPFERLALLSEGRISKWKDKKGIPNYRQALTMARLLKVPVEWLLDDEAGGPPPPLPSVMTRADIITLIELAIRSLGEEEVIRRLLTSPSGERPQPQARILGNAVLTDRPQKAPSEGFQRQHESSERPD